MSEISDRTQESECGECEYKMCVRDSRSTIYNELKRGEYMHRNSDYTETLSYSPNKAQMKAEENLKARGTQDVYKRQV